MIYYSPRIFDFWDFKIISMFQFDKTRTSNYLSIQKRKLTLSASRASISSLSPNLIKFFQAESQDQQDDSYNLLKRQYPSMKEQFNNSRLYQKIRNKRVNNLKTNEKVRNQYGIGGQRQKKVKQFKQNNLKNKKIEQNRQRAKSQDIEKKGKIGINSQKMSHSNFYFTFGNNQLWYKNYQSRKKIL